MDDLKWEKLRYDEEAEMAAEAQEREEAELGENDEADYDPWEVPRF